MWAIAAKWLFGTSMGRGVLLGSSLIIGAAGSWYFVSDHYYDKGVTACQLGRAVDANAANVAQGNRNIEQNTVSSEVGKAADTEAAKVVDDATKANHDTKETVADVYRQPPSTAPVVLGSCAHPLDRRVQQRIDDARAAALGARGP